jgi:hypothetical protein
MRLHLGGGLEPDDGLFRSKADFSSQRSWFFTAKVACLAYAERSGSTRRRS